MTAIAPSQVPPQLVTIEQYCAWSGLLLHRLNPTLRVLETENNSELACTAATFTADDNTERLLLRINFKLDPNWQATAQKLWLATQAFSNTEAPSGYLA